jgi:hypothetical protein
MYNSSLAEEKNWQRAIKENVAWERVVYRTKLAHGRGW